MKNEHLLYDSLTVFCDNNEYEIVKINLASKTALLKYLDGDSYKYRLVEFDPCVESWV